MSSLPLSKRAIMEEWMASEKAKNPPAPPDAFWAVSPGINWSWYALLQPEDEGFRILKYDRIHHGDPSPKTGTSVDLIEDKGRTVTGVRLSGERSTGLKTIPVTNPGHVFGYPPITFEDEQSFAKAREKKKPEEPKEAAVKMPLSKRAYDVDYWIKWARKMIELGEKLSHDELEAEGMADMRTMLDDAERQGSAADPKMVHALFHRIVKTIGRRALASMRSGADLIEQEKGGSKALDHVRKTIDTLEEILLEGTDPARIQHWMMALHEVALQLHGIKHEEDRERALQEYFRQRDLAKRKKEMKLVPMPEGTEPPEKGADYPKPEPWGKPRLVPKASRRPPLSKRAASGPRAVGDKIRLRGHGKIQFEVVGVATHGEETYYKVKPVDTVYGVSEGMVEEERHSEKRPVEEKGKGK